MSHALRRDIAFAVPFLILLAAYALSSGLPDPVRGGLALLAAGLVASHAATGDELARARSFQAGALAFLLVTIGALALAFTGIPAGLAAHAQDAWAGLFVLYLACWSLIRLVRG